MESDNEVKGEGNKSFGTDVNSQKKAMKKANNSLPGSRVYLTSDDKA